MIPKTVDASLSTYIQYTHVRRRPASLAAGDGRAVLVDQLG